MPITAKRSHSIKYMSITQKIILSIVLIWFLAVMAAGTSLLPSKIADFVLDKLTPVFFGVVFIGAIGALFYLIWSV